METLLRAYRGCSGSAPLVHSEEEEAQSTDRLQDVMIQHQKTQCQNTVIPSLCERRSAVQLHAVTPTMKLRRYGGNLHVARGTFDPPHSSRLPGAMTD